MNNESARERDIPLFIFVERDVLAEYQTFKDNRDNEEIKYAQVDSVNIYKLLDEILAQRRNNFVRGFEKFNDIADWLRSQWAGLFADFLDQEKSERSLKDLSVQLAELNGVSKALKEYSESMMKEIKPENFQVIIDAQAQRLRIGKIERFSEEPMIEFLVKQGEFEAEEQDIFDSFEASVSIEGFLESVGCGKDYIKEFLKENEPLATRDYNTLKKRYILNNNLENFEFPPDGSP